MKVKVEVDATPEELRRFFGLPDVTALQEEMLAKVREKMTAGIAEYDPVKLMEPFLPEHLRSLEGLQKSFWSAMAGGTTQSGEDKKD